MVHERPGGDRAGVRHRDAAASDLFGGSVSIDGDTVLVGARGNDDSGSSSGSAYVFTRSGTIWTQQTKLLAGDGAENDYFGTAVAIDGDALVIGANMDDDVVTDSGSVYAFVYGGDDGELCVADTDCSDGVCEGQPDGDTDTDTNTDSGSDSDADADTDPDNDNDNDTDNDAGLTVGVKWGCDCSAPGDAGAVGIFSALLALFS